MTKEILGYREEALGSFIVKELKDKEATGELKELLVTRIIPGDLARLSTEKTKLVFASAAGDVNELVKDRLLNILRDSGRFEMLGIEELPKGAGRKGNRGAGQGQGRTRGCNAFDLAYKEAGQDHGGNEALCVGWKRGGKFVVDGGFDKRRI